MKDHLSTLLRVFLSFLVLVLIIEGVYRVRHWGERFDPNQFSPHLFSPYRTHELNPGFRYQATDGRWVKLHSPDGFRRDGPVTVQKAENVYRVIMLGGSALYGVGATGGYPPTPLLENRQIVDHHLEEMLNQELALLRPGMKAEVINAGITGYHTFQHLVYISERLHVYQPDLFIFLDGHNDYYIGRKNYNHWRDYPYGAAVVMDSINEPSLFFAFYMAVKKASGVSFFAKRLFFPMHQAWNQRLAQMVEKRWTDVTDRLSLQDVAQQYPALAERSFMRAYGQIRVVAEQLGAGMLVVHQPELILEAPENLTAQENALRELTISLSSNPEMALYYAAIHQQHPALFAKAGLPFLDLATFKEQGKGRQRYVDYCHLTEEGMSLLAQAMLPQVRLHVERWLRTRP